MQSKTEAHTVTEDPTSEEAYSSGWLSPDGLLYTCSYQQHRYLARVIAKMKYDDQIHNKHFNAERMLEENGWIKLCKHGRRFTWVVYYSDPTEIHHTKRQIRFITDHSITHEYLMPGWIE